MSANSECSDIPIHKENEPLKLSLFPCAGIVLTLFAATLYATSGLAASLLTHINPLEITLVSGILQIIICLPISCVKRESLTGTSGERIFLFNRCFFGLVFAAAQFAAFKLIPLGDVSTIAASSPIFTYAFAWILMKEECGIFQFILVPIVISGIILISRPAFLFGGYMKIENNDRMIGSLLALLASVSASILQLSIRKLRKTPVTVVMTQMGIIWTLISAICLVIFAYCPGIGVLNEGITMPSDGFDIGMLLLNGLSSIVGQALLVVALQVEEAGPVSVALSFDIVMSYVLQSIFLPSEEISLISISGALLICLSVILAAIRKWIKTKDVQLMCV